ncbi:nucleotide-diphospho-sugar transferase [Mollisia scopiformis]|uniref:Nucleotide-diphospho-sugar transferase n=1 Tax=Mollisia scopiformis TaxID=149040 RepID=A0A194XTN0_MOLSC|nr:nucleotide-diphospho-sugar transferase [Mollisia scopiformis]KUJ23675.1 nucleotide-diphospho-sugar transferase [Mollisia scopiformis]
MQQINTIFGQWRPRLRLVGENVPTVDVIITCCNEDIDIVLDTVRAALRLDYPQNRYRVIVADDGSSAELSAVIFGMAERFQNLYYTARVKRGPDGYKAGNLNHTLKFLSKLPQGSAELVAGLDADMIPETRWLRAMTPHLVENPRLAVVCPPQHYYNVPLNDPLWQAQKHSYRCKAFTRDMADSAWCTGSGWVIRREALIEIGGFPLASLTEDLLTSTLLLAAGWKSGYVAEALQYGQVPESYHAHVKQFTRWTVGLAQIGAYMRFTIPRYRIGKLTLKQRLACMEDQIIPFFSIINTMNMMLMPIFLFTDLQFVYYRDLEQMKVLLRLKCLGIIFTWINLFHTSLFSGFQACVREGSNELWMAPYYALAITRSIFLPAWLGGKVTGFTPTGTISNSLNERQRSLRSPMIYRLKNIMINCGAIFHLGLLVLCSFAITNRVRNSLQYYSGDWQSLWISLLTTVAWPPMQWFQQISACLTPLQYAIFPPDVPDRESLLDRDGITGVAYPTSKAKQEQSPVWEARYVQLHCLSLPYVVCVLISTWWI